MVDDLGVRLRTRISEMVATAPTVTRYREPLVGFAAAADPLFGQMKQIIGERALLPADLLPEARSVVSWFVPFHHSLVEANRQSSPVAREWAVAYIETNRLINDISHCLAGWLAEMDVRAATVPATHNFDVETLTSRWSHKSVAYIAGLGTFGVHQMLITERGTAGRFGSLVMSAVVPPTPRPTAEFCLHRQDGGCLVCVKNCPVGALSSLGFDRQRCYQQVLAVDAHFADLELCDVCGKCAVGPCALGDRKEAKEDVAADVTH